MERNSFEKNIGRFTTVKIKFRAGTTASYSDPEGGVGHCFRAKPQPQLFLKTPHPQPSPGGVHRSTHPAAKPLTTNKPKAIQ